MSSGDEVLSIVLTGTDEKSSLTVKVAKGDGLVTIASITGDGGLKTLDAKGANLVGEGIALGGLLGNLVLRAVFDGVAITAGGLPNQKTKITRLGIADGGSIDLGSSLAKFTAATVGTCAMSAPSAGTIAITGSKKLGIPGDFAGTLTLSGDGVPPGKPVLTKVSVKDALTGARLEIAGNVGAIQAGRVVASRLFAGYAPDDDELPLAGGDFAPLATIKSVKAKAAVDAFVASHVVASSIGKVGLASVATDNEGTAFGVPVGTDGVLGSVKVGSPAFTWQSKGADDQSVGDFHVLRAASP